MPDQTSELLRSATAEPSATPDFAELWQQGRRRRRRVQMLNAASGLAVAALVVVVAATVLPGRQGTFVELGGAPKETAPATPAVADGPAVQPLAKMDGWSPGVSAAFGDYHPFAVLEIAYDQPTAEQAWDAVVPDELPNRRGYPAQVGLYGSLDSVDFSRQAVVVWSSVQSGSCPSWLADITTDGATVEMTSGELGEIRIPVATPLRKKDVPMDCTADDNPYSMVLAVDRDRLPERSELPTDDVVIDGQTLGIGYVVDGYPTSGWPEDGPSEVGPATDTAPREGSALRPLAKMDRWSRHFAEMWKSEHLTAAVEIAYDRPTAELAWDELAADGLPPREGKPRKPGLYAPLDSVDFATEAVVVWSSGQSGTCPSWVANIATDAGRIAVTTQDTSDIPKRPVKVEKGTFSGTLCTDDYRSYSMLLAVDLDRLPEASELPTDAVTVNGGSYGTGSVAAAYPITGWPEGGPSEP